MVNGSAGRAAAERPFITRALLAGMNLLFFVWFCLFTLAIAMVVLVPNYVYYRAWKRGRLQLACRRFIELYGRLVIRLSWPLVRVRIENREAVQNVDPCVYVMNHFSFVDVFFCGYLPGYSTVIAIRSWPFRIPFLNIFMRIARYMDVEKTPLDETLRRAAELLREGNCMLFFPEGHRSRDGRLQPFSKGAFRIAAENDVPVVPVGIEGTATLGGYRSRLLTPSRVRLRFFPPLRADGKDFTAVKALRQKVEGLFQREIYGNGDMRLGEAERT
jgi:1-acyl-sn-glycerol-3-phosphate acyltransferase